MQVPPLAALRQQQSQVHLDHLLLLEASDQPEKWETVIAFDCQGVQECNVKDKEWKRVSPVESSLCNHRLFVEQLQPKPHLDPGQY